MIQKPEEIRNRPEDQRLRRVHHGQKTIAPTLAARTDDADGNGLTKRNNNDATVAKYEYDALGRRMHGTEYIDPATGGTVATPRKTWHVYVGLETIEEYDATGITSGQGALLREFLWGDPGSFPEPWAMVTQGGESGGLGGPGVPAGESAYHYLHDALGSVVGLTDSTGVLVERYTYDPYGRTLIEDQSAVPIPQSAFGNPWLWTGQRYEPPTGLYAFLYRTYSSTLGRWLQRDPIGYVGSSISLYLYGLANPLRWIDPLGLQPTAPPAPQPGSQPSSQPTSGPSDEVEVPPSLREGFDEAWKQTEAVDEKTGEKHEHGGVIVVDENGNPKVATIVKGEPGSMPPSAFRGVEGAVGDYHTHPGGDDLPPSFGDMHRALRNLGKTYFVVTGNCTFAIRVVNKKKARACSAKGSQYTGKIWEDAVRACAERDNKGGQSTSQCSLGNGTNKCINEGNCAVAKACGLKLYGGCGEKKNNLTPVACP